MIDLETYPDELVRAKALADLLCGAAMVDDELDPDESEVIFVELRRLLSLKAVPPALEKHVRQFDRRRFDAVEACTRLRIVDAAHKKAVMRAVRAVIKADSVMRETERDYFERVAGILRVAKDID